jgi:Flp pilus assembly protein TadB
MSRNQILAAGALLWTVVILDGFAHFVSGDVLAPAFMIIVAIASVFVLRVRRSRRTLSEDS